MLLVDKINAIVEEVLRYDGSRLDKVEAMIDSLQSEESKKGISQFDKKVRLLGIACDTLKQIYSKPEEFEAPKKIGGFKKLFGLTYEDFLENVYKNKEVFLKTRNTRRLFLKGMVLVPFLGYCGYQLFTNSLKRDKKAYGDDLESIVFNIELSRGDINESQIRAAKNLVGELLDDYVNVFLGMLEKERKKQLNDVDKLFLFWTFLNKLDKNIKYKEDSRGSNSFVYAMLDKEGTCAEFTIFYSLAAQRLGIDRKINAIFTYMVDSKGEFNDHVFLKLNDNEYLECTSGKIKDPNYLKSFNNPVEVNLRDAVTMCALENKGLYLKDKKRFSLAVEVCNEIIQINDKITVFYAQRAGLYSILDKDDLCLKDCNKLESLGRGKDYAVYVFMAKIYFKKQKKLALRYANRAVSLAPEAALPYFVRGGILGSMGMKKAALIDLDRAISFEKNNECRKEYINFRDFLLNYKK